MRIFCKKSLFNNMKQEASHIFQIINNGVKIYENLFKTPFPFTKYDQIFCPELYYLGMENPGAVLLTENYLYEEKVSRQRITSRCLTLMHELSHMWFGNLVTMKWWDDIWLNESFAVYIAHWGTMQLPNYSDF